MTGCHVRVKNHDFVSPYSDTEVVPVFNTLVQTNKLNGEFALSMHNSRRRGYSERQLPWLHVLVAQAEKRPTTPQAPKPPTVGGYAAIHSHLVNCRTRRDEGGKGLLNPMVGLQVGDQQIVLKLAGERSRNRGKVSVASDHRYGQGVFYGWITDQGAFETRGCPQAVIDILNRVAVDPAKAISEIGKESGRCCYCFAELSQVGSKIAGCGKTCSENYDVWYPTTAEIRLYVRNNPTILDGASDRDRW